MDSRKRKYAVELRLNDLPGVILERVGSFLSMGDKLKAVRICKKNEGLRPILWGVGEATIYHAWKEDVEPGDADPTPCYKAQVSTLLCFSRLKSLSILSSAKLAGSPSDTFVPTPFLEPLFASVCSCLKFLEIECPRDDKLDELACLLPLLESLETLRFYRRFLGDYNVVTNEPAYTRLLLSLPRTIRSLTLDDIDGSVLKSLATLLLRDNVLPVMEELYLPCIMILNEEDAESFGLTLQSSVMGQRLKTLHLYVSDQSEADPWHIASLMLGLNKDDPDNEILATLNTLILGHISWRSVGQYLLKGGFRGLTKVLGFAMDFIPADDDDGSTIDYADWFEIDAGTQDIWFEVFQKRAIGFGNAIRFTATDERPPLPADLVKRLFRRLAQPIGKKVTSKVEYVQLDKVDLDETMCGLLVEAVRSSNFSNLTGLEFLLEDTCGLATYTALGEVLGFLPFLDSLSLGVNAAEEDLGRLSCWGAFFGAIPADGLSKMKRFTVGAPSCTGSAAPILHALAALKGTPLLKQVSHLFVRGEINDKDLMGISAALISGSFPFLREFCFYETVLLSLQQDTGAMRLFLTSLAHHAQGTRTICLGDRAAQHLTRQQLVAFSDMFLTLVSQSPDKHLSSLELIFLPGGPQFRDDLAAQEDIKRFHNDFKALRPNKWFRVVVLDYSRWIFDVD